jgi:glycerophosphoryl diester phosphodiesterase
VYLSAQLPDFDTIGAQSPKASAWTAGFVAASFPSLAEMVRAAAGKHSRVTWSPHYRNLNEGALRTAHSLGLKVVPWTVNEVADMQRLIELGVDGIITDYPDRLVKQ